MKKYTVKVMFEFQDEITVLANTPQEANKIAEQTLAPVYSVFNAETDEIIPFDELYGFDPEEVQ
jgi:hypothetical protein